MTNGFFITGTDTGIGKTSLAALLVAALDANYWKPIQTGSIEGTDRETVRRLARISEDRLMPEAYCFEPPVSPHLAAREAGVHIRLDALAWPPAESPDAVRTWIVEGAGGALVPINESETMIDVMRRIGLPVIVAARSTLGTINHTLLTLAALRYARLEVRGVVFIGDEHEENRRAIEHYGDTRVLGRIPWTQPLNRATLLDAFARHFDRAALLATGAKPAAAG
ncbi:MAG: dethiobiotin synthase [Candidatus Acidiferrales bacterium]